MKNCDTEYITISFLTCIEENRFDYTDLDPVDLVMHTC